MSDQAEPTARMTVFIIEDELVPFAELEADQRAGVTVFALSRWAGAAAQAPEAPLPSPREVGSTQIRALSYGSPLVIQVAGAPEAVSYVVAGYWLVSGLMRAIGRLVKDLGDGAESRARGRLLDSEGAATTAEQESEQRRQDLERIRMAAEDLLRPNLAPEQQQVLDSLLLKLNLDPDEHATYIEALMQLSSRTVRVSESADADSRGDSPDDVDKA